ncbi:MAG: hypothetical protein AB7V13_16285 [Pseudorhodoplanes sp.]|uniref:hypothetical protein n=1 Tax=Pseudorhodoplanes sp. TaxID=1934341 RepID=UPI003D0C8F8B
MADRARKASRFGCLIPIGLALLMLVALPYSLIAFLFWAADGSWDFEGRDNLRYWLFVKGSRLDRLGLVSPAATPPAYSVRLQEGTFPGWTVVTYRSAVAPEAIARAYAQRCRDIGLKVTRGPQARLLDGDETGAELVCEIEPYLDVQIYAGRKPGDSVSLVSVRVWGSD